MRDEIAVNIDQMICTGKTCVAWYGMALTKHTDKMITWKYGVMSNCWRIYFHRILNKCTATLAFEHSFDSILCHAPSQMCYMCMMWLAKVTNYCVVHARASVSVGGESNR